MHSPPLPPPQAYLVDLRWWELSSPPVHGPLDNVLGGPASIVLLGTVPGLPASREELDGGVAPDLQGGVVKVKRVRKGREREHRHTA